MKSLFQVNGNNFFPLGAQCCNSSAYSDEEMEGFWSSLKLVGANTAEIPIYWSEFEPEEGVFRREVLERHVLRARAEQVKLIFLWFGTWKNGTSKFAPGWALENTERFRRVITQEGIVSNILSPYCRENLEADKKAFCRLAEFVEEFNQEEQIIIGVQIQNEPGLMTRSYRDHCPDAERLIGGEIPERMRKALMDGGCGHVTDVWLGSGKKTHGTWEEVFGADAAEIFSAYGIASYIDEIAAAGREITGLPFYTNVWVDKIGWDEPGLDYPSGGPVSKMLPLWKRIAPHLSCIGLDNYRFEASAYRSDCLTYSQYGNRLFIPESNAWDETNSYLMFYAIGDYACHGFCLFGTEAMYDENGQLKGECESIIKSYRALAAAAPVLHQYIDSSDKRAIVQEERMLEQILEFDSVYVRAKFGGYERTDYHHGYLNTGCPRGRGLLIRTGEKEFLALGDGYTLSLREKNNIPYSRQRMDKHVGYKAVEEGRFDETGKWICTRVRNGDESDYGIWIKSDVGVVRIVLE